MKIFEISYCSLNFKLNDEKEVSFKQIRLGEGV